MCLKLSGQASRGFGEGLHWLQVLTKTLVWVLSSLLSPRSLSFPTFLLTSCTFPAPTPVLFFQSPSSSLNLASASPCCTLLPPGPCGVDPAYLPRLFLRVDKGRPCCRSEFLNSSKAGTLPCTHESWGADARKCRFILRQIFEGRGRADYADHSKFNLLLYVIAGACDGSTA